MSEAGVAGACSSSSESCTTTVASALVTFTNSPHSQVCPHCQNVLVGEDALVVHIKEEHPASMVMTSSTSSTAVLVCSNKSEGLKRRISVARGGLLDGTLSNQLKSKISSGLNQPIQSLLQKQMAHSPVSISTSTSGSSLAGRLGPVSTLEPAKKMRRLIPKQSPTISMYYLYPYICFYCGFWFKQQSTRNRHIVHAHWNEVNSSKSKQSSKQAGPDDASSSEDSDHSSGINISTLQEVLAYSKVERSCPEPQPQVLSPIQVTGHNGCSKEAAASGCATITCPPNREMVKQKPAVTPSVQRSRSGRCGVSQAKCVTRFPLPPASSAKGAAKLVKESAVSLPLVETDPLMSPKQENEFVCVEEEIPVLHKCDLPNCLSNAQDPLRIDEEIEAVADDPLHICNPQSIKKEVLEGPVVVSVFSGCVKEDPQLDLGVNITDTKEAATRGNASDITR
ncbi:uncharacterized protein LOC126427361 [Schistocerca serialis cubense]|uniref:uncharacterized protein LOC126427361 n=1 Tax=Schistocerca serialis cubense TaxID=2023355 RepID=UPI00214E4708|nr:uncharacterized protein LOC126427361 [Schistocerca serialis cubense]